MAYIKKLKFPGNTTSYDIKAVVLDCEDTGSTSQPIYFKNGLPVAITGSLTNDITGNAATATNATNHIANTSNPHGVTKAQLSLGNVVNLDQSKAIKSITRSGTTFTYTCLDNTTGTFTQQDNNTIYSTVTSTVDGLVPKFDAADGTIDNATTDWVLTNNNGSIGWYKLPANAFNNNTYTLAGLVGSTAIGTATKPVYWDGSKFATITSYEGKANTAGTADKVANALSFSVGGVNKGSYNGSAAHSIDVNAADLNISGALSFLGRTASVPTTSSVTLVSGSTVTAKSGNVVIYTGDMTEYLYDDTNTWIPLGSATSFSLGIHVHGNIDNNGYLTTSAGATLANRVLMSDSSGLINAVEAGSNGQVLKMINGVPTWGTDNNTTYTLSGLGGIGTISASGTSPLTLSASKSGTTVTISGSVSAASTSTSGVVQLNANTLNTWLNQLGEGTSTPVDADYYISQYVGGGTTTTTYHRRPMSAMWSYIKGKIDAAGYKTSSGVTSVATGAGLTGGTITSTGTIKANLNSETSLGTIGTTSKLYAVGVDANGKLCVNVPWTDNNTTYSAGTGISLSGTTFSNSGVRSITTGSTNGTISVNTNGTSAEVAVKGLGSNAYTSTAYLPLAGGELSGDLRLRMADTDRSIIFDYDGDATAGASWRIAGLGSGSGDTNYFAIQSGTSTTTTTTWADTLKIGQNTYDIGISGNLYPLTNNSKTLGTSSYKWANVYATTFTGSLSGNASSATEFAAAKSVALTGDVTGSASSKGGWSITTTLANSGVTAASYGPSANASPAHGASFSVPYITVDAKGRITSASTKTITLPSDSNTWRGIADTSTAIQAADSVTQGTSTNSARADHTHNLPTSGVTAGSYGPTANVSGSNGATISVPQITVDKYGRVTSVTNRTYTSVNTDTNTDTKNTTGSTDTSSKIYLVGATSQAANPQTYSDNQVYATDGQLDANTMRIAEAVSLVYDSTNKCLNFVFA